MTGLLICPGGFVVTQWFVSFQAIAVVFGFLVAIALIIMLVFALKTRQKITNYGKSNILWKKVKVVEDLEPPQEDVEAWVSYST